MEKVSIIVASYNYAQYLSETIESVLSQDCQDWELIIIDDGSMDNSVDIIKTYQNKDSRIKLYQHEGNVNKGLAETIKLGVAKASSEWVVFLESDDKLAPNSLSERLNIVEKHKEVDLVFTNIEPFQDSDLSQEACEYMSGLNCSDFNLNISGKINNFEKLIIRANLIPTFSVVMVKKSLLEKCDFNSPCKAYLDFYLWAQLSCCNIFYLAKKLTYWRMHTNSYINRAKYNWFSVFYFYIKMYSFTIKNKNILLRIVLLLNYIRARLFYIKIAKSKIKINLLNNLFIYEKRFD